MSEAVPIRILVEDGLAEIESTTLLFPPTTRVEQLLQHIVRREITSQKPERLVLYGRANVSGKPVALSPQDTIHDYALQSTAVFELRSLDRVRVKLLFQEGLSTIAQKVIEYDFQKTTAQKFINWVVRRFSLGHPSQNLVVFFTTRKLILMGEDSIPKDVSNKDIIEIRVKAVSLTLRLPDETLHSFSTDLFLPVSALMTDLVKKLDLPHDEDYVLCFGKNDTILDPKHSLHSQGVTSKDLLSILDKASRKQGTKDFSFIRKGTNRNQSSRVASVSFDTPKYYVNMLKLDSMCTNLLGLGSAIERNPPAWTYEFVELGGIDCLVKTLELYVNRKKYQTDESIIQDILRSIVALLDKNEAAIAMTILKSETIGDILVEILNPAWSLSIRMTSVRILSAIIHSCPDGITFASTPKYITII